MLKTVLLWILSAAGALNCLWVAYTFGVLNLLPDHPLNWLFPLPGLYLVEIALVGFLGLLAVWRRSPSWLTSLWVGSGILLSFVILGMWTLGLFLIPSLLFLLAVAFMLSKGLNLSLRTQIRFFLGGALGQAALILILFNL